MSDTFITNALDQMTSRTNFIGHMASDIYCTDTDGEPRVAHQITAYYAKLQNARSSAAVTNSSYSGTKPETLFTFLPELMTKVCWNARRQIISQKMAEENDLENGQDYSQATAKETGVYVSTNRIPEIVNDDYQTLQTVYGILLDEMDYFVEMVDNALPLYIEKEPDTDGNWQVVYSTGNWDDALERMNEKADALRDKANEISSSQLSSKLNNLLKAS